MSKIDYNEMTNAELKAIIDDFEIGVEAKIPGKPNKAELVAALEKYKAEQDALNGVNDSDDKNDDLSPGSETVVREAVPQRLLPKNERKKLLTIPTNAIIQLSETKQYTVTITQNPSTNKIITSLSIQTP